MLISKLLDKKITYLVSSLLRCNRRSITNVADREKRIDSKDSSLCIPDYVDLDVCPQWNTNSDEIQDIKYGLIKGMRIFVDFISEAEESIIFNEIEPYLKRMRYEFDHWDDAIHGFRETEKHNWKEAAQIIQKAKEQSFDDLTVSLPHTHVLDLDAKGFIKPHVDSVRFCGTTVAGMCLLSPAVMRLRHSEKSELFADFLLSRRCLYVMKDKARYDFSHEVLKDEISYFKGRHIARTRRISIISRNQPVK